MGILSRMLKNLATFVILRILIFGQKRVFNQNRNRIPNAIMSCHKII